MAVYKDETELMNTDWQSKINQAVAAGDMNAAAQYEQARNDKINAKNYTGAQTVTNKYQDLGGANAGTTTPQNQYANTNYHKDAINAAMAGNWDAVTQALNQREEKVAAQGGNNRGKTSADIYAELWNLYGEQEDPIGDFTYGNAPSYYDSYSSRIDEMLNQILNRDKFSYNAEEDPMYQQYAEQYQREGERAMQNTLGEVSARTGGLASSYATTAAQQANQYYAQQLADKIPELYQLAYQMYLDDINLQAQDLGLLQNASNDAYNRYRDTMADWYADIDFAYGAYRDQIADDRYDNEWEYSVGRDQIADERYDKEWEYNVGRDEIADQRYQTEWEYQLQQDAIANARAASSGGSRSGGGNSKSGSKSDGGLDAFLEAMYKSGDPELYMREHYDDYGYARSDFEFIESRYGAYLDSLEGDGGGELPIHTNSILALGFGPISGEKIAELEALGVIELYEEDGYLKARKTDYSERSAGDPTTILENLKKY